MKRRGRRIVAWGVTIGLCLAVTVTAGAVGGHLHPHHDALYGVLWAVTFMGRSIFVTSVLFLVGGSITWMHRWANHGD